MKQKVQDLIPAKHYLLDNLIGLEKESLRSYLQGSIAQSPHPHSLGSPLTNSYITTDFSESLLEMVTPPLSSAKNVLDFLRNIEYFVNQNIDKDEVLWQQSMPSNIKKESDINIAEYGTSNIAKMKTVYRNGLAVRYGCIMQSIAGIHFNYSYSPEFLKSYYNLENRTSNYTDFVNESYMAMSRNILRYSWLLTYLFGASPVVSKTFIDDRLNHSLVKFNDDSLYEEFATSLRVGDIGYQNNMESSLGVRANYNSLEKYINSLEEATKTPCETFEEIGLKKDGEYQQLNTNILQIENEYYSNVRPKQLAKATETVSNTLRNKGILYIELRTLDLNPLLPLGINEEQILFLEVFLLYCLLTDSPCICFNQQQNIDKNDKKVAHSGRKKDLKLIKDSHEVLLVDFAKDIFANMSKVLPLFSAEHKVAFDNIEKRIYDNELTPSAIIIKNMLDKNLGFIDYNLGLSKQNQQKIMNDNVDENIQQQIKDICKKSVITQKYIEQNDNIDFSTFLTKYFS